MYSTLRIILPYQMTLIYVQRQLNSVSMTVELSLFWSDATISFVAHFHVATIWVWHLFLWKIRRHVCMSDTVTTVRCCQWYTQSYSPALSHGNESYNTNTPSATSLTIICIRVHVLCILAMATTWGWRLFCSELLIVWLLFEKYGICVLSAAG